MMIYIELLNFLSDMKIRKMKKKSHTYFSGGLKRFVEFIVRASLNRNLPDIKELEGGRIISIIIRFIFAFIRSMIFFRRLGFVMSKVEVRSLKNFKTNGFFTIETGCLIDCYGEYGVCVGQNFKLGRNSIIAVSGSYFSKGSGVLIGKNVGLGEFAYIGGEAIVRIGDNTISGQYLSIHPENHSFAKGKLYSESGTKKIGVKVGKNVWIGAKVTLLDGSVIGDNCIVAAGAVVNSSFPDNCVIGGVPSRIIRKLDD
jgi:acetyltransferase-like isoleucine patch superfamily enzyme